MNTTRSNRWTSCSFLSSAPCSGGMNAFLSGLRSASGEMSSASRILSQSSSSDVDGFFLRPGTSRRLKKTSSASCSSALLESRVMHVDDPLHRLAVGKADVVEEAAAQERVGQLLLVVRRDDHQRPVPRLYRAVRLVDVELHPVELVQQVVRELDVGLVDFVDQHDSRVRAFERLPQHARLDVVGDVGDLGLAQLRIPQPRHGVVFVESLLRLGRGLDVPLEERAPERARHLVGEQRLAGAGLALDQQGPLQRQRRVDGEHQVRRGDVTVGAFETHAILPWPGW